jgi:hypothetical protein
MINKQTLQKLQRLVDLMKPHYNEIMASLKENRPEKWAELNREAVKLGLYPAND